jgi:hypothetical protein
MGSTLNFGAGMMAPPKTSFPSMYCSSDTDCPGSGASKSVKKKVVELDESVTQKLTLAVDDEEEKAGETMARISAILFPGEKAGETGTAPRIRATRPVVMASSGVRRVVILAG